MAENDIASRCSRCSFRRTPGRLFRRMLPSVALRTSIDSGRRSVPFQLQQVEGMEERLGFVPPPAEHVNGGHALLIAAHHLTVDQAGPDLEMVTASTTRGKRAAQSLPRRVSRRMPGSRRAISRGLVLGLVRRRIIRDHRGARRRGSINVAMRYVFSSQSFRLMAMHCDS
jgi:hypothetical protein